jgi:hypothetical protein
MVQSTLADGDFRKGKDVVIFRNIQLMLNS